MKTKTLIITAVVATVGLGAFAFSQASAHGPFGPGGYGQGYGPGYGSGPGYGMMHQGRHFDRGYRPGMMQGQPGGPNCPYAQSATLDKPLTVDDVRANLEQHLQWRGNDRLKVGTVTEQDDKTIIAEIVTVDDSLVRKIQIDKTTGMRTPVK